MINGEKRIDISSPTFGSMLMDFMTAQRSKSDGYCVYFVDFILIMQRSKSNGYFVVDFIVLFLVVKNLLLNRLWKCHGYLFGF